MQTRGGIKFRHASNATARWCQHAENVLRNNWEHPIINEGAVRCKLTFLLPRLKTVVRQYPTGKREGDIDKQIRSILDAMTGVVYRDDSQVIVVVASKHYTDGEPGVFIEIDTDL